MLVHNAVKIVCGSSQQKMSILKSLHSVANLLHRASKKLQALSAVNITVKYDHNEYKECADRLLNKICKSNSQTCEFNLPRVH